MTVTTFSQILSLYTWFPLAIILAIYLLIARFYHRFSGKRTYFWLYSLPILSYGVSFVRYASIPAVNGDLLGDLAGVVGGLALISLSSYLTYQMMRSSVR